MNFFFLSQFENYSLTEPISKINEILSSLLRISAEEFYVMYQGKPLNPKISGIDHGVSRNSAIEINFRCKGGLPKPVHTSSYTQYSKNEIRTHKLKFFDYARYLLSHDIHEGNMTLSALQKKISDPNNTGRERHIEEICSRTLDKKIIILVACNDQDTIVVALEGNIIQYYDCELTLLTAYQADAIPDDEKITCLGMSCDDNYLYIGTNQGNIYIYNAPEERFHKSISPKKDINYTQLDEIKQIYGFKSDQKYGDKSEYFAVLDSSCQVIIYNAVTLEEEKLASMKLNSIVQPKATSPLHRRYTTQANFTLGKIKEIRVNDSKTELNCITSKRVTKVTLRIIESKVVPFLVPRPPEENEFPSNLNLTPSHDFTEKELEDYYHLILLIVSSSNETEFWIDKNKNTIIGFDRKKFHLIKPHDEILSENLSVLRGAHLYVSRYQNKIKILKATQLVEEIFNTEADKIHSKFMHSKKKGKFNFRKVKKPALCIVISPDNKYLYSGWEDGKIRVMNLQKRKEEAEILTVEILEESLLPPNNKGDSEIITNLKSPKDYQKRQNRTKIISHLDILLKDQLDYSENAQDNEFISDMEVTALSVSHNFIIGGYSNGYIVFFNHHIHNYQIFKVYKGPDSDNHPRKLRKINSMLVTKDQRTLIVSTPVMIYKLSLNQDPPEVFLERTDIYIYYNPSMKKSTSSLFNLDDSTIRTKFNPTFNQLTYVEENLLVTKVAEKDFIFIEIDNPEENVIISLDRNIPGEIVSLGITQDLDKIVIACSDGTILIYEVESKNLLNRFSLKKPRDGTLKINDMKLTEEGMLIFAMESGELRTVEISTQEEDVRIFEDLKLEHKHAIRNISLSADEEFIALNYNDWSQKITRLTFYKKKQKSVCRIEDDEWISGIEEFPGDSNTLIISAFGSIHSITKNKSSKISRNGEEDDNSAVVGMEPFGNGLILIYSYGRVETLERKDKNYFFTNELESITYEEDLDLITVRCAKLTKNKEHLIAFLDESNVILIRKLSELKKESHPELGKKEPATSKKDIQIVLGKEEAATLDTHPLEFDNFICGINRDISFFTIYSESPYHTIKKCHQGEIHYVTISKKGNLIASVSKNYEYKLHDWKTKVEVYSFFEKPSKKLEKNCLAFAQGDRLLVYCGDYLLKIRNVQTRTLVYDFKVHKFFTSISISSDQKLLYCGTENSEVKVYHMPVTNDENQIIPHSETISPYVRIGSLSNILLNFKKEDKWTDQLIKHKDLYYWPYNWSILHIVAIMNPHLLRNIPEYSKLPLNCIVDYEKKTPLHYLREAWISNDSLEEKNISLYQINKIFHYILDFLEAHRSNHYTYFETMKSLTTISMFILTYASPDLVSKFLRSSIYNQPHLHSIGSTSQKIIQIDLPLLRDQDIDLIYKKEGTEWVKFKILGYSMDFDSLSEESLELIRSLKKITNQEYFKTKAISVMIDHFWNQNFSLIGFQAFLFTCLIVLISINFGLDHKEFGIQIIILILVTIFVLYEILQMWSMKSSYFKDFWNYIDLSFYAMAITGIVAQLAELDDYIKLGWIYTSALFTGYGRWITYLRLFDLSRNLIRTILDMMKRMWAFVIIIASVILACSIMFYTFDRQQIFSDTLLNTYYMLYGNVTFPHLSLSQSFIAVAVTFVLGVFFLNMLVSILNDSFNTTQKLKVLKDAHERLEILLESINVRKIFIRCRRRNSKPGYLAFCETVHDYDKDDETDTIDIKDRVKIIQNKMNESELTLQNQIDYLKSKILETESKVDGLKDSQKKIMEKLDSFSNYPKESIKVKDSKSSKIKFTEVERIEKKIQFTE